MNTAVTENPEATWIDGKRLLWLLSPMLPTIGLLGLCVGYWMDASFGYWMLPLIFYGVVPLLDWMIGTDLTNPPESAVPMLEGELYYRVIVYAYLPAQFLATILGAWLATTGALGGIELVGAILTVGMINGIAINTAHELGHKKGDGERWLAKLTLAPVAYGHFFVEHNKGHHKNVATPEDPASSRMGETFWQFLPRTMIGSVRSAWHIEKERLARRKQSVWSTENDNLQAWMLTVILFGALTLWLGWPALAFLAAQAFYGAALLEVINYIEHYGLLRQKGENGRYERCTPAHSWNSNNIVTNLFLYQLQRHSDHHANPTRRFQALRHFDESPQLPSGYASMLLVAYFPALWFRQMDPLVAAHYEGNMRLAHIHEPKREALMARWQDAMFDDGSPELFPGEHAESEQDSAHCDGHRYQCTDCGYVYDEHTGCEKEGFPAGTAWASIPDDWPCPDCAVREKMDFRQLNVGP